MPWSPLKVNRRFGGTCLHLQERRINRARSQLESRWQTELSVLARLVLWPWRWRLHAPPKRRLDLDELHSVISQKIEIFIGTSMRTSNPATCDSFTSSSKSVYCTTQSAKNATNRSLFLTFSLSTHVSALNSYLQLSYYAKTATLH
jgi:hypothetical protein